MNLLGLPVGANPDRDIPWGTDELGNPQFRASNGTIYSIRQNAIPQRQTEPGTLARAGEVGKEYIGGAIQSLFDAVTAPRRALSGEGVTYGDALNTAGMLQLGGAASMGRGVMDYDPNTMRSFSDYLSTVNPRNIRVDANDRPNLMMGDMYGMLPRGSRKISQKDGVTFHRGPDGDYYATAYNPDVGEQDVVGYIMPRGDMTELAVVNEMQGKGIGSQLQYLLRRENPNAPTGGLTEGGEAALRKTYDRLVGEGILSANRDATAAAIALPVARNESEAMARIAPVGAKVKPKIGEAFDDWIDRIYAPENRGKGNVVQDENVVFRAMSPEEAKFGESAGAFKDITGQPLYVANDPERYIGGGAYGGKRQGRIYEFDATGLNSEVRQGGVGIQERAISEIPTDRVRRVWEWNPKTKAHELIVDNTLMRASDDPSGILASLPTPRNESEAMARKILEMRAAGRAGEVTEEMMAAADPQYMYRNTPLPMDEASRMARAQEMGFDTGLPLYHGTTSKSDFSEIRPSERGKIGPGVYMTPNASRASVFAGADQASILAKEPPLPNARVFPLVATSNPADEAARFAAMAEKGNYEGNNLSAYRKVFGERGFDGVSVADERTILDPKNIRSRFARFDPEFSHLSNLSAANVSPEVGLLGMNTDDEQRKMTQLLNLLGL